MFIASLSSHLLHVADLAGEDVEQRLHPRVGERLLAQGRLPALVPRAGGAPGRASRFLLRRRWGQPRRDVPLHADEDLTAGHLLSEAFEPRAILLELVPQRALIRREAERHTIAGNLDLLGLCDDHVVEDRLRLADLG